MGIISGFEHFDACTFTYSTQSCKVENDPIIVTKGELSGDRQGFNVGHDLGHLILDIEGDFKSEQAANRFTGAFLVPAATARVELGTNRTNLNINELHMLKHKYGLSIQAWIYRTRDLSIISENTAARLFQQFRVNDWYRQEPGKLCPSETPIRMERLIYHALAEDLISRSRAQELSGKPLQEFLVVDKFFVTMT